MFRRLMIIEVLIVLWMFLEGQGMTVVIDPGHGGPGGGKFGSNGDGWGSVGPDEGLTEEWVNLQVSRYVADIMDGRPPEPTVVLTRPDETTPVSIDQRVQIAKTYNAAYFISIHHNGFPLDVQGSEVWWDSTYVTPDSGLPRYIEARDSIFAKKTLYVIRATWDYPNHCSSTVEPNWMQGCNARGISNFPLLHKMRHCPCLLSEASNLNDYSEEDFFKDSFNPHAAQEGNAINTGWHSYYTGMGFARISNRYIGGDGKEIYIDQVAQNSPAEWVWEPQEQHSLDAISGFYDNGYLYQFHHWAHLTPNYPDPWFPVDEKWSQGWDITVWYELYYHYYRAYFTGGPYFCYFTGELPEEIYTIGDSLWINYVCSPGVDSSSLFDVYIDRHNGRDGFTERLCQYVRFSDGFHWGASGAPSESCLFKIVAYDIAGNGGSDTSDYVFAVRECWCGDADGSGGTPDISDAVFLIAYVFGGGPAPGPCGVNPLGLGDADGSGGTPDISDSVFLIAYVFGGGPVPCCTGPCTKSVQQMLSEQAEQPSD